MRVVAMVGMAQDENRSANAPRRTKRDLSGKQLVTCEPHKSRRGTVLRQPVWRIVSQHLAEFGHHAANPSKDNARSRPHISPLANGILQKEFAERWLIDTVDAHDA